ncbi:Uncharacterised protein [Leminorella richardii]|uniref:Uncharacterized protein n=1 Tax=Leminorella richardii TaxID=158841 RepID=A0A2X4UZM5_9GAMM|nr:Uncharacterised protein [Leminorella richardii]
MTHDATKKFSLMRYRSIFSQRNLFLTDEVYIVANSHTHFEELLATSQIPHPFISLFIGFQFFDLNQSVDFSCLL